MIVFLLDPSPVRSNEITAQIGGFDSCHFLGDRPRPVSPLLRASPGYRDGQRSWDCRLDCGSMAAVLFVAIT